MSDEIKSWCDSCDTCQRFKARNHTHIAPLKPIIVTRPLQLVGIDVVGPLPVSKNSNKYIIIGIDYFSKWIAVSATKTFNATTTAEFIMREFISNIGTPESIISDRGTNFESEVIKQLCILCGVTKLRTTSHHHEGVGMVERVIRTFKDILKCYINSNHDNWDSLLYLVKFCYNTSVQSSANFSPYEIVFARKPTGLHDLLMNVAQNKTMKLTKKHEYLKDMVNRANSITEIVNKHLEKCRKLQKEHYDKQVTKLISYKIDDLVLLKNFNGLKNHAKKLLPKFIGPYKILRVLNDLNFSLSVNGKQVTVHYNRMCPYKQSKFQTNQKSRIPNDQFEQIDFSNTLFDESFDDLIFDSNRKIEILEHDLNESADNLNDGNLNEIQPNDVIQRSEQEQDKLNVNEEIGTKNEEDSKNQNDSEDEIYSTDENNDDDNRQLNQDLVCPNCAKKYQKQDWFNKHLLICKPPEETPTDQTEN